MDTALDVLHHASLGGGADSGIPGQVPVNAGAAAGVNVERPQRASARTNDVGARKVRRSLRLARGSRSWAEELLAVAAAEQEDEPLQVLAQLRNPVGAVAGELFQRGAKAAGV